MWHLQQMQDLLLTSHATSNHSSPHKDWNQESSNEHCHDQKKSLTFGDTFHLRHHKKLFYLHLALLAMAQKPHLLYRQVRSKADPKNDNRPMHRENDQDPLLVHHDSRLKLQRELT